MAIAICIEPLGDCTGSTDLLQQSVSAVLKTWPQCGFHSLIAVCKCNPFEEVISGSS